MAQNDEQRPVSSILKEILSTSDSIQNVLDRMSRSLCARWKARRCALFLFDESSQRIVLRAVYGGLPDLIGKLSFGVGESLAGMAMKTRQVAYTDCPRNDPTIEPHPRLPIDLRGPLACAPVFTGEERVGLIALQRNEGYEFTPQEIQEMSAEALEIGGSLESARALMLAAERPSEKKKKVVTDEKGQQVFEGEAVSAGIGVGMSRMMMRARATATLESFMAHADAVTGCSLDEAIAKTEQQLHTFQEIFDKTLPEATALLFEAQLLMLKDDSFVGKIREMIDAGAPAQKAIAAVATEFIAFFESNTHDYLREKSRDVEDLALRLLDNIAKKSRASAAANALQDSQIVVTDELLPSDILRLAQANVRGIVLVGGGSTAHITLLVRSLKIPMVMIKTDELLHITDNEPMIVDCDTGRIILRPENAVLNDYSQRATARSASVSLIDVPDGLPPCATKDGERVTLMANINLMAEFAIAQMKLAEGVGLYRTEFPFLMRSALPTEDEQLNVYRRLLDAMPDRPITIRTLDAGGDKVLSYFDQSREENPALGLRSTRFTLRYHYIFNQQLRAILRAVQQRQRHDVSIMFPMIGSLEELEEARARVQACFRQVKEKYADKPAIMPTIGTMVELPAVAYIADEAAKSTGFFSIGTNDFIQYMLAADRTNAQVASYYTPHHPAVLHGLAQVVRAAKESDTPVSICGEMGRNPLYIPFFIGIGVREFSVEPRSLYATYKTMAKIDAGEAKAFALRVLKCSRVREIAAMINETAEHFGIEERLSDSREQ